MMLSLCLDIFVKEMTTNFNKGLQKDTGIYLHLLTSSCSFPWFCQCFQYPTTILL